MLQLMDIQGIALSSYADKEHARFLFLGIDASARSFFAGLSGRVTSALSPKPADVCLNVGFTASGLLALGLEPEVLKTFAPEFAEGMAGTPKRSEILGDTGSNAPESWLWGGRATPVDAVLMLYARDDASLERLHTELRASYGPGVREQYVRTTKSLPERREHFGFVDGISQPRVRDYNWSAGDESATPSKDTLPAGEFILGYANEYGKLPASPAVASTPPAVELLPESEQAGHRDLGKNGTYLVFRQIDQDVAGFWDSMLARANGDRGEATRLAAKCVGRWPSGTPLVCAPQQDDPAQASRNDFGYAREDPEGLACPFAAHIRRTNPRDSLRPNPEESTQVSRRHALLRRGRSYGEPLAAFSGESEAQERGLMFVCVNANIGRQFEFVQQTWVNNPKFDGLYDDRDPLLGSHEDAGGTFTIPAKPFRERLRALPRFTRVRGGEYFFAPGLRALRFLAG